MKILNWTLLNYQTLQADLGLLLIHIDSDNFGDSGKNKKIEKENNKNK